MARGTLAFNRSFRGSLWCVVVEDRHGAGRACDLDPRVRCSIRVPDTLASGLRGYFVDDDLEGLICLYGSVEVDLH